MVQQQCESIEKGEMATLSWRKHRTIAGQLSDWRYNADQGSASKYCDIRHTHSTSHHVSWFQEHGVKLEWYITLVYCLGDVCDKSQWSNKLRTSWAEVMNEAGEGCLGLHPEIDWANRWWQRRGGSPWQTVHWKALPSFVAAVQGTLQSVKELATTC